MAALEAKNIIMRNTKLFDQWRSFLSLKTPVLLVFFVLWNVGFVIAMFGFGNGFGSPITAQAGVVISIICLCACVFSLMVTFSKQIRQKLIEPRRAQNYRAKDFHILSFVTLALSICMLFFPRFSGV